MANWHKKRIQEQERERWRNLSLRDYAPTSVQSILPNHPRSQANTATYFDRPGSFRPVLSNSRNDSKIRKTRTDRSGIGHSVNWVQTTVTAGSEGSETFFNKFSCTDDDSYKYPTIDGQFHDLSNLSWPGFRGGADNYCLEEQPAISAPRAETRFFYQQPPMLSEYATSQIMTPMGGECMRLGFYCLFDDLRLVGVTCERPDPWSIISTDRTGSLG